MSGIDIRRVYKKEAEINNKISEDLTYEQFRQSENMPEQVINNLEILFSSMDHADNLGHINYV